MYAIAIAIAAAGIDDHKIIGLYLPFLLFVLSINMPLNGTINREIKTPTTAIICICDGVMP